MRSSTGTADERGQGGGGTRRTPPTRVPPSPQTEAARGYAASLAQRKPRLAEEESGVLEERAATR
ncbi:hypothetical protein CJD44_01170 [Streptomyces sp. alain-838]|nr:hypothetical protein CJD44_01170 [Streptomyces sp. alain-838]